jgi:hypothetical protein
MSLRAFNADRYRKIGFSEGARKYKAALQNAMKKKLGM